MTEPGLKTPDSAKGWTDMTKLCRAFGWSMLMSAAATLALGGVNDRRSGTFGDPVLGSDPVQLYWPFNRSSTGDTDPRP